MLSFIVPAHNEEAWIARSVGAIRAAAEAVGGAYEVIVVDDASTDATAQLAEAQGAQVVHVNRRQISAARNAGAQAARGDVFVFVDADTLLNAEALWAALEALGRGAVGGGCAFRFDGVLPLWAKLLYPLAVFLSRRLRLVGGCCLFCTRAAYEAAGGFCEQYYAAEEAAFLRALKRQGAVVIPGPTVITSGRKLRAYPAWKILAIAYRWALRGPKTFQQREGLEIWYGPRNE